MEIQLELPWPPTVNTMWRSLGRGRTILSEKGRIYRETVAALVLTSIGRPMLDCGLSVAIAAYPPDRKRRDLDNLFKGVLDSLAHAGVYADDYQIQRLSIERREVAKPGRLVVEIVEI